MVHNARQLDKLLAGNEQSTLPCPSRSIAIDDCQHRKTATPHHWDTPWSTCKFGCSIFLGNRAFGQLSHSSAKRSGLRKVWRHSVQYSTYSTVKQVSIEHFTAESRLNGVSQAVHPLSTCIEDSVQLCFQQGGSRCSLCASGQVLLDHLSGLASLLAYCIVDLCAAERAGQPCRVGVQSMTAVHFES